MTKRNNNNNKKDKDDSKRNTCNNNKDDINMTDIDESNTLKEITVVAKSLHLKVGGRKSEVLKRIHDYIKDYKEIRKKNIVKFNNGNNDKKFVFSSSIKDLAIKNISNGELLFWKIFKNKVLFQNITSNFGKDRFHSYNNIVKVDWMIDNGHINLLFDKLKRNQPLIIDQSTSKWYDEIFKVVKSSTSSSTQQQDSSNNDSGIGNGDNGNGNGNTSIGGGILEINEFYQLLFERFANYIHCPKKVLNSAIKHDCLDAIQVLLEEGYYDFEPESVSPPIETKKSKRKNKSLTTTTPTQQLLIVSALLKCLKHFKFTIFQYLYQYEIIQSSNLKEINDSICMETNVINSSNMHNEMKFEYFKFLKYFLELGILNKTQFNQKVDYLLKCSSQSNSHVFPKNTIQNYTLLQLIQSCEILVHYKSPPTSNSTEIKSESNQITLNEIQSIKNQFNNQQLKSNLELVLSNLNSVGTSNNSDNNKSLLLVIKRLIDFYYQVAGYSYPIEYFLIFGASFKIRSHGHYSGNDAFIKSLEYGNSELLKLCFSEGFPILVLNCFKSEVQGYQSSGALFKYCSNRDQKIKFIKVWATHLINIIESFKNKTTTTPTTPTTPKLHEMESSFIILYMLIANDDIELVQLFIDEIGIDNVNSTNSTEIQRILFQQVVNQLFDPLSVSKIHNSIRSIEMLNYCYSNFKNHFIEHPNGITSWYFTGRTDLLETFEKLIGENQYEALLLPLSIISDFHCSSNKPLKTIEYIVSKPTGMYKYDGSIFKFSNFYGRSQKDYQSIKNIIQHSDQSLNVNFIFNNEAMVTSDALNFIEWLFTFKDGIQLKSGRVIFNNDLDYYRALAITDRVDCNLSNYIDSEWYQIGVKHYPNDKFEGIHGFNGIKKVIIETGDIKLLEILFSHFLTPFFTNSTGGLYDSVLYSFFSDLISNQWLHLIQHIYHNHRKFMTNTKSNGYIDIYFLKKLRDLSITMGLLDTFNFFLKVLNLPITKIQYNKLLATQINQIHTINNLVFLTTRNDYPPSPKKNKITTTSSDNNEDNEDNEDNEEIESESEDGDKIVQMKE